MNTKQLMRKYVRASYSLLLAFLLLLTSNVQAREMQTGSDAYTFSIYMIDAFYSEGESCEEKLLASPTIGWLCAAFPLGQNAFEHRWEAYLSALPETYSITAVTSWGDIKYEEDDTVFYGKIYDLNDGRLVVGYDQNDRGSEIRLGFSSTANQATATQNTAQTQVQPQQTNQVQQVAQTQPAIQAPQVAEAQTQVAQTQIAQAQVTQPQQEPVFLTAEQTRARDQAIALHNYNQQQAYNQQNQQQNHNQQANTQNTYAGTNATQQSSITSQPNTYTNQDAYAATSQPLTTPTSSAMPSAAIPSAISSAMASATNTNLATSSVMNTAQQLQQNQYTTTETPLQTTTQAATQTLTTQRAYNATQSSTAAASQLASSPAISSPAMSSASTTNLATSSIVNDAMSAVNATNPQAIAQQIDQAVNSSLQQLQSTPALTENSDLLQSADLLDSAAALESTNQLDSEILQTEALQTEALDALATQEIMALAQNSTGTGASSLGAAAILDVFSQQGLSVRNPKAMTTKDYGFAPVLANEGLFFNIGDCTSCIGRIFSFEREEDVAMMEVYYSLEAQATDIVYSNDNTLLQFFSTPKELAQKYITALEALN